MGMLNRTTSWLLWSSVVVLLRLPNDASTRVVACGRGFPRKSVNTLSCCAESRALALMNPNVGVSSQHDGLDASAVIIACGHTQM